MDIDKIQQAIAKRDAAIAATNEKLGATVAKLQEDFAAEQRELAQKYVDADIAAQREATDAFNAAVEAMDAELRALADGDGIGKPPKDNNGNKDQQVKPTATPTAVEVAAKFSAAALRTEAKARGLATTGTEVAVAQRLLDAGWRP
ncbi:MAG: hypothetical protein ACRDBH_05000 [Bosea sp. (in: a-proteobacteria)]